MVDPTTGWDRTHAAALVEAYLESDVLSSELAATVERTRDSEGPMAALEILLAERPSQSGFEGVATDERRSSVRPNHTE